MTAHKIESGVLRKLIYSIILPLIACSPQSTSVTSVPQISSTALQTIISTPAPAQTPKPTFTPSQIPTVDIVANLASEFDISAACLFSYLVSTDGDWIGADCKFLRELIIANKPSGAHFVLPYAEIDTESSPNLSTQPLSWSSDNRHFYFTTRCCEFDDALNSNGSLYQLDTEENSWNILIQAVFKPFYFFSQDGQRLVFLNHYPLENSGYPEHLEAGMVDLSSTENARVVFKHVWGPLNDKPRFEWSESGEVFAIILDRVTIVSEHTTQLDDVLLRIDFSKMEMELLEEFEKSNLSEN